MYVYKFVPFYILIAQVFRFKYLFDECNIQVVYFINFANNWSI